MWRFREKMQFSAKLPAIQNNKKLIVLYFFIKNKKKLIIALAKISKTM
jgi:hypothetical protein